MWRGRAPAHGEQLTPGQTSPRSSGNSSPPHHCCPRMCYPDPFLGATHTLVSAEEITGTPPPSATSHPCCLSVAQAPLSSARPHLWLLTARSGWQQRPDARTCSEKGQGPAGQERRRRRSARTYWSIGRTPLISPAPDSPQQSSAYLLQPATSVNIERAPSIKRTLSHEPILAANIRTDLHPCFPCALCSRICREWLRICCAFAFFP